VRKVRYPNPKPANFEQAEQVVVEGRMDGQAFAADHILVKCPSKYNDAKGLKQTQAGPPGAPDGRPE
jgi:cytochrome c-type biogenesis protein CcmE